MDKVYTYPQKIFKTLATLAVIFGVTSCATSQSTASSGETDGVYYSPSKDGQVQYVSNETPQDYEIKVGGAYFDAEGNGAEEYYYEEPAQQTQDVNIYTGSNNIYLGSGNTSDWGRYDGIDITVNNWGWNDPWWGYGYNSWGWGMGWSWGWSNFYWGYPRWRGWYDPYWGWNYNPYWGWGGYYNPYYYGYYHGGYYGGYYAPGYYYRSQRIQPGTRPGSNLAFHNGSFRSDGVRSGNAFGQGNTGVRPVRNGNIRTENGVRSNQTNVRPVRVDQPVRNNNALSGENPVRPVRTQGNVRTNNSDNPVRPVRATVPKEVRDNNAPVRSNNQIRTNNNNNSPNRTVTPQRNNPPVRSNQGIQNSPSRGSDNGGIRSSGGSSRGSSGGGVRSGGGRR